MRKHLLALAILLVGSLSALAQNSALSHLPAGSQVNATDNFYDEQTAGVGGVSVSAKQVGTYTLNSGIPITGQLVSNVASPPSWLAGILINTSGYTIPSSGNYSDIRVSLPGGGNQLITNSSTSGIYASIYTQPEILAGSSPSSNSYAIAANIWNDGPGTTKAIHTGCFANVGSTGVCMGVNSQLQPVSTTGLAIGYFSTLTSTGVNGLATSLDVESSGDQYGNAICGGCVNALPIASNNGFVTWAVSPSSGSTARFLRLMSSGSEIAYWDKAGNLGIAQGSAGAPSLATKATPTTGFYFPAASEFGFSAAGTLAWDYGITVAGAYNFLPSGTTGSLSILSSSLSGQVDLAVNGAKTNANAIRLGANLVPDADNNYPLGGTSNRWSDFEAMQAHLGASAAQGTFSAQSPNTGTPGGAPTAWSTAYSIFGPNVSSATGAALGFGYDTTDNASIIISLAPNVSWEPLYFQGSQWRFLPTGAAAGSPSVQIAAGLAVGGTTDPGSNNLTAAGTVTAKRHTGAGSTPTANSCAGFSLSTGSSDFAGKVTFTSATTCSITFGSSFTNTPFCVVTPGSAASTIEAVPSTSGLAVTFGTANTAFQYICAGI